MNLNRYQIFNSGLFWFMLAHLGLLIGLLLFNIKNLIRPFYGIGKKTWVILFFIFLMGFYLRNSEYWLGTHTDGYVAQETANYWLFHGKFVKGCALGNIDKCELYQQVLAPAGFPFLIALFSLFVGFQSLNASIISADLSSLTVILVFLIAYLLFYRKDIGLIAAFIFSLIPLNILESQSGAFRPTGLFFAGLTILIYLIAINKKFKFSLWILIAVCLSYSIYVRQESYILLPFLLIFIFVFKSESLIDWIGKSRESALHMPDSWSVFGNIQKNLFIKVIFIITVFLLLQIPVIQWLIFHNPHNVYAAPGIYTLHYENIFFQIPSMLGSLLNLNLLYPDLGDHYNFFISILFLIGFLLLLSSGDKKYIFIIGLFLIYFLLYSLNLHTDGYAFLRRSLMYQLPYSIIAAYPIAFILRRISILLCILLIVFLIITTSIPFVSLFNNYVLFKDSRVNKIFNLPGEHGDVAYFLAVDKTPADCLIITTKHMIVTNDYFRNNHREAIDIHLIYPSREDIFLSGLRQRINKGKVVLYFEDGRDESLDFAYEFIDKYFKKIKFFSQPKGYNSDIVVYRLELKESV